jgi:SAM-dependent methyltransferase
MENKSTDILTDVADYYSARLAEHGQTPRGVDWNGEQSQFLRFAQLCKIIDRPEPFTLNDLGCGYGALLEYLSSGHTCFTYTGCDISGDMVQAAMARHAQYADASFVVADKPPQVADYGIASGIFNVRLERSDQEWRTYLESTLAVLDSTSRLGFAFNCLTSYSDADKMRDYLYYADPSALFDLCKRRYSRHVSLLHDYGLYEFTILVRKAL